MSNSLTAFNVEFWAKEMQAVFFKENVAISLANTEYRDTLSHGDTLNKPYRSALAPATYTKGSTITSQDISGTNEYLSVDTAKVVPFYLDDIDAIQNKWDTAGEYARDAMRTLNNVLDQAILAEYSNAANYVDDGDIGGTAGTYITMTTTNIDDIFLASARKLDTENVPQAGRFAAIGPRMLEALRKYVAGKDTSVADRVGENGYIGSRFGFELYYTNNAPFSAKLSIGTTPTDADTVSIAGVTFTWKATLGTTAGNIHIASDAANSVTNLVTSINAPGTTVTEATNAGYVAVSAVNQRKLILAGIVAVDGTTYLTITGYGDVSTAETLTAAADVWSLQYSHVVMGHKGATDLIVQKSPNVVFKDAPTLLGKYCYPWMLYGKKTFVDGTRQLVDVRINAASWTNV